MNFWVYACKLKCILKPYRNFGIFLVCEEKRFSMATCEYEELRHRNLEDNRIMVYMLSCTQDVILLWVTLTKKKYIIHAIMDLESLFIATSQYTAIMLLKFLYNIKILHVSHCSI